MREKLIEKFGVDLAQIRGEELYTGLAKMLKALKAPSSS